MQRIRFVATGLGAQPAALQSVAIEPLRQHEDGRVYDEDLQLLGQQEQAAAAARDYRTAGFFRDTLEAVQSGQRLTIADCSPTDPDEQHAFFLKHGFILLHNILPKDKLRRAQAAWNRAQAQAEAKWHARRSSGADNGGLDASQLLYYDLPNLLAEDDVRLTSTFSLATLPLIFSYKYEKSLFGTGVP